MEVLPDGTVEANTRDVHGRLTEQRVAAGHEPISQTLWSYDAEGQVASRIRRVDRLNSQPGEGTLAERESQPALVRMLLQACPAGLDAECFTYRGGLPATVGGPGGVTTLA